MARQQSTPKEDRSARAVFSTLAICCALPAIAATPSATNCEAIDAATLEISITQLDARTVHHEVSVTLLDETAAAMEKNDRAPSSLLVPQAEAAIRNAFTLVPALTPVADDDSGDEKTQEDKSENSAEPGMNTRLPGISDEDLLLYKKQMFRRDI